MTEAVEIKAYAKVNLALDVLRKRSDGYHDVKMIMQTVDLYDILCFEKTEKKGIELSCDKPEVPLDDTNLIYKAAKLLMDKYDIKQGVKISLDKNIPVAAGMAGGSTDCAATFKGIKELFKLGITEEEMKELGVKLGADVPYCVAGGTALSEGIGEILTELSGIPTCTFLIAKPNCSVSTKEVYTNLHLESIKPEEHPDIDGMIEGIKEGNLKTITDKMDNILEKVTIPLHGEIAELKNLMLENGACNALMSGSGPTVFGIFTDTEKVWNAMDIIADSCLAKDIFVVGPKNRMVKA